MGRIQEGKSYHIMRENDIHELIHVHKIQKEDGRTVLSNTIYTFMPTAKGLEWLSLDSGIQTLKLCVQYETWEHVGEVQDAFEEPNSSFHVVRECLIEFPEVEPEGVSSMQPQQALPTRSSSGLPVFVAKWAFRRGLPFEMRSLRNRSNTVVLNPHDLINLQSPPTVYDLGCGIGGPSVGFGKVGFNVRVGVEESGSAGASWKVISLVTGLSIGESWRYLLFGRPGEFSR